MLRAPLGRVRAWIVGDGAVAIFACLPLAILYCTGVQRTVGRGDSAEFVVAAYTLGLAHPPGYPIYTLLGRLCCLLPWGTIAQRVNFLSAICASAALVLIFRMVLREAWSATKNRTLAYTAAIIAMILVGLSPAFWRYAVVAEAYAMNALSATVFAYLVLAWLRTDRPGPLWGASLALGIAVGTHLSTAAMLPVLVGIVLLRGRSIRSLLWSLGLVAVGASQYVYVIVRLRPASANLLTEPSFLTAMPAANTDDGLANGIWYVTGGPWRHAHPRSYEGLVVKFSELTRWIGLEYPLSILVLALLGVLLVFLLGDGWRGLPETRERIGARWRWGVLASIALGQMLFYICYRPSQIGMVLPMVVCIGVFAAAGVVLMASLAGRMLPPRIRGLGSSVIAVVTLATIVIWAGSRAFTIRPCEDHSAALVAQMIDRLPAGSFLAGVDYRYGMIINYYHVVEKRPINFRYGGLGENLLTENLVARDTCFVLGTPRNLLRFDRAGIELEPYLTQKGAPTVYLVRMSESELGANAQNKSQIQRVTTGLGLGGRRVRNK